MNGPRPQSFPPLPAERIPTFAYISGKGTLPCAAYLWRGSLVALVTVPSLMAILADLIAHQPGRSGHLFKILALGLLFVGAAAHPVAALLLALGMLLVFGGPVSVLSSLFDFPSLPEIVPALVIFLVSCAALLGLLRLIALLAPHSLLRGLLPCLRRGLPVR